MGRTLIYRIDGEFDSKRLIAFLRGGLKMSSRTVVKLKNAPDGLLINGKHARTVDAVRAGDLLEINFPEEKSRIEPSACGDIDVIYEDGDILVINKPAGLAMHPTHNHQGDTLANMAAAYFAAKNQTAVFRAVGRLDKCTSGVVLCALNRHAASRLSGQLEKEYIAVAGGEFSGSGTIDAPIIRPDSGKTLRAVGEGGERAVTHWECLGSKNGLSVLKIHMETGRTHQIRVHFAALGAPLAGDDMYGSEIKSINRAALHCAKISLTHPVTGELLSFSAPLPQDMQTLVAEIMNT